MVLKLPFVMEFVVYLTNRCNLRCKMCSQYGENYKENACPEIDFEKWKDFFRSLNDVEPRPKIILIGGEPLLYPNIDKILAYLTKKNFGIQIVTNGVFLDKHLSEIKKCKNLTITISLDGLGELHDSVRGVKGTFEKAISNIEKLNLLRKQGADFKIYINSVLLPDNISQISDFLEFIQTKNVDQVVFQHLQFSSEEQKIRSDKEWEKRLGCRFTNNLIPHEKYNIDEKYTAKLKEAIANLSKVCRVETFIFPYLTDEEIDKYYLDRDLDTIRPYLRCSTPWTTAFINPMGGVSNCINYEIGNITKNNFWQIWNSEKAHNFRNNLCKCGNFEICSKCCNFYKSNFLYAKNARLNLRGKDVILPAELNYILPAPEVAFVLDKSKSTELESHVYPVEIHSPEMLEDIKKENIIVGYSKDILLKGEKC